MNIRQATISDSPGIARVHIDSWKTTYRGQIPSEHLNQLSIPVCIKKWEEWFSRDQLAVVIAEDSTGIHGFSGFGPCKDSDIPTGTGEVYSIYLLAESQGAGVGRNLWQAALQHLRERGFTQVVVWVLDTNLSARGFYERMGCTLDGGTKTAGFGGQEVSEVRYRIDISDLAS
jgi:ribosomal protein S18 acetylase RimI-like enzyme